MVLDIYEFTSFSNIERIGPFVRWFWISTNLHHSQTVYGEWNRFYCFGYLRIYIILKLWMLHTILIIVLDIYEFTSFSNLVAGWGIITTVLNIYEFTSFSSIGSRLHFFGFVLDIYEFTSFSNLKIQKWKCHHLH